MMKARLNSVKLRKINRMSRTSMLLQTGAKVKAGLGGLNPLFVMVYVVKEELDLKPIIFGNKVLVISSIYGII